MTIAQEEATDPPRSRESTMVPLVVPDREPEAARVESEAKLKPALINFRGRIMEVRYPNAEQYAAINMVRDTLRDKELLKSMTQAQSEMVMRDAFSASVSLLTSDEDVAHIRSLWLSGKLVLEQTLPILSTAMEALNQVNGNRATKRAAAKKASPKIGAATLLTT